MAAGWPGAVPGTTVLRPAIGAVPDVLPATLNITGDATVLSRHCSVPRDVQRGASASAGPRPTWGRRPLARGQPLPHPCLVVGAAPRGLDGVVVLPPHVLRGPAEGLAHRDVVGGEVRTAEGR